MLPELRFWQQIRRIVPICTVQLTQYVDHQDPNLGTFFYWRGPRFRLKTEQNQSQQKPLIPSPTFRHAFLISNCFPRIRRSKMSAIKFLNLANPSVRRDSKSDQILIFGPVVHRNVVGVVVVDGVDEQSLEISVTRWLDNISRFGHFHL